MIFKSHYWKLKPASCTVIATGVYRFKSHYWKLKRLILHDFDNPNFPLNPTTGS